MAESNPIDTFFWFFVLGAATYVGIKTLTGIKDKIVESIDNSMPTQ